MHDRAVRDDRDVRRAAANVDYRGSVLIVRLYAEFHDERHGFRLEFARSLGEQIGQPGFDDGHIRSSLMGFIVGGPTQPPIALTRREFLKGAGILTGTLAASS